MISQVRLSLWDLVPDCLVRHQLTGLALFSHFLTLRLIINRVENLMTIKCPKSLCNKKVINRGGKSTTADLDLEFRELSRGVGSGWQQCKLPECAGWVFLMAVAIVEGYKICLQNYFSGRELFQNLIILKSFRVLTFLYPWLRPKVVTKWDLTGRKI